MTMIMFPQLGLLMAVTMHRLILPVNMGVGVDMGVGMRVNQIPVGMKMGCACGHGRGCAGGR